MMDDWYFGGMHWIWWGLWVILIFWIFLIPYPTPGQKRKRDLAMDALRERYARGEIDEEEFEKRKKVLEADKK
ncbi:SHOCT domain-containing protein [Maribacter stanieri]|uniref:SHOCT domain-containing protein n=1 Tax=Maribacter stanieri TaxID=440514 RepID=UPI0030D8B314|tara:strand:+ start:59 stop:277 length:219 start_codon:yes stop_codon:yes gene_type:complete